MSRKYKLIKRDRKQISGYLNKWGAGRSGWKELQRHVRKCLYVMSKFTIGLIRMVSWLYTWKSIPITIKWYT